MQPMKIRTGLGQDSHRFEPEGSMKPLVLGGYTIPDHVGLNGNSDADVILHCITNAISGITGVNILGKISDDLCLKEGITDSRVYLAKALEYLGGWKVSHMSMSIEAKTPKLSSHIDAIKASVAALLGLDPSDVGCTATTGEGLTAFGRGEGMQVFAIVTAVKDSL